MLVGNFGAEAARGILAIDDHQWHGPFESVQGIHFIRIVGRTPEIESSYGDVRSYLEGDWRLAESRKAIEQEIERLQESYEIVIKADLEVAQ